MINITPGLNSKPASTERLIEFFQSESKYCGIVYTGYPILSTPQENLTIDAIWISREYGIVIFDIIEGTNLDDRQEVQNNLYNKIKSKLAQYSTLNIRRDLAVNIEVITYAPVSQPTNDHEFLVATTNKQLLDIISRLPKWDHDELFEYTLSVIQSIIRLKSATIRSNVTKSDSRGAKLKTLEDTIANLDTQQEKAVIRYHEGPQRIRGLAGSGKTIVLALKAAYLHALNPEWNIIVTYHTRSLKKLLTDNIETFFFEHKSERPNWNKLRIIHAWGSRTAPGLYYEVCENYGIEYFDFKAAELLRNRTLQLKSTPFEMICKKALEEIKEFNPVYDAILVDEAQDLSSSFLKLCFNLLKEPKRLIYAYDELQKLDEGVSLPNPVEIFGKSADDIILHKCYRNSRPVLVTAHALGFGIYRNQNKGLVQFFDKPQLWNDVGYNVEQGVLRGRERVKLARTNESSPKHLEQHSPIDDLIIFKDFSNSEEQAKWVAEQITKNINDDELLPTDIVVINPLAPTTKKDVSLIRSILFDNKISSHITGEFDADIFFRDDSIAFSGIFRAKGNEVPMVYIVNADSCYSGILNSNLDLKKKRNTLFTAITRSKAWVRCVGIGDNMQELIKEYESVKSNDFALAFVYPTEEEISKINLIHRDLTEDEKIRYREDIKALQTITKIIKRINSGDANISDYPEELQEILREFYEE